MITLTPGKLKFQGNAFKNFKADYERAKQRVGNLQKRLLQSTLAAIKQHLANDPRSAKNQPYPWKNHTYMGGLVDSLHTSTTVNSAGVVSKIGYSEDYGTTLEPAAELENNVFVPVTWSPNPDVTLNSDVGTPGAVPERTEDIEALEEWAYNIISKRTTGRKLYGAAARSAAQRWARNLQYVISMEGQMGYPTIVPMVEKMFQGTLEGNDTFFDDVFSTIQEALKMTNSGGDLPF